MNRCGSSSTSSESLTRNWARYYSNYPPISRKTSAGSVIYSPNFRRMSAPHVSSVTPPGGQTTSMSSCGAQTRRCASRIQRKGRRRWSRPRTSDMSGSATRATPRMGYGSGRKRSRRSEAPGPMPTSSSSTKSGEWGLRLLGISCVWPKVLRLPPRQNRDEDESQEEESEREPHTMSEVLGDAVEHHDRYDDVHDGDEVEEDPPDRFARDLQHHDAIVDRDDRRPARLSGLGKHLPHRCDVEEDYYAPDDPEHHSGAIHRVRLLHWGSPRVKVAPR